MRALLQNEYLDAKIGIDTAENEPSEVGPHALTVLRAPCPAELKELVFSELKNSFLVKEIAETKMPDLNANDIEAAMEIIKGSARSMGIEVKD